MKFKLSIATAALLAVATAPAWALQLGQIQVKSALNQPLVAAIPLHPKNLTELDGLTVGLASPDDFSRAGLQLTSTDRTLRFHVVTDNNGQKLILVTSSQPVTDPYLDFLVQVNTRNGKQVREFVVLLNPVIAAPAPTVQAAPVASAPAAAAPATQPAELPAPTAFPQPVTQPQPRTQSRPQPQVAPKPAPTPPSPAAAASAQPGGQINVQRGDTLYGIAQDASQGTDATINQMMLALKSANPKAFFKDNINDLKAGAILRIPTRDEINRTSIAEANAEVHRQYEAWRAAKPHPATVVAGTAAAAAARAAPQTGPTAPASDHLALVPPTDSGHGAGSRPGVTGGTGSETVAGLQQRLQDQRGSLASLNQSNADLESRVHSLADIAGKSDKLLSLKDATVAELQRKLADMQSGNAASSAASNGATTSAATTRQPAPGATVAAKPASKVAAAKPVAAAVPWYQRPLSWIVAALIVVGLVLIGLLGLRRRGRAAPVEARGPLPDPEDVAPQTGTAAYAASLQAQLVEDPDNLGTHLSLCRLYHAQGDAERFVAAAASMHAHVHDPGSLEWHEVAVMGEELAPGDPLFAVPGKAPSTEPEGAHGSVVPHVGNATGVSAVEMSDVEALPDGDTLAYPTEAAPEPEHRTSHPMVDAPLPVADPIPEVQPEPAYAGGGEPGFSDDPVDTKLDLARAYLDMGDPSGARAMLDEVLDEGSQTQKDEARRLLADAQ